MERARQLAESPEHKCAGCIMAVKQEAGKLIAYDVYELRGQGINVAEAQRQYAGVASLGTLGMAIPDHATEPFPHPFMQSVALPFYVRRAPPRENRDARRYT